MAEVISIVAFMAGVVGIAAGLLFFLGRVLRDLCGFSLRPLRSILLPAQSPHSLPFNDVLLEGLLV